VIVVCPLRGTRRSAHHRASSLGTYGNCEMKKRFGVSILGGSGYGAGELLRLLACHPNIEPVHVVTRSHVGKPVSSVHSHLESICDLTFTESLPDRWWESYDSAAVISSMPAGQAGQAIADILSKSTPASLKFIDLSGDLRLKDPQVHARHYSEVPYSPEIRTQCVYGLSELAGQAISQARIISNPGCLSSASILALAPLRGLQLHSPIIIDAKTGTSGAGREPQASMHHPSRASDFTAYKVLEHRHEPEILQALGSEFSNHTGLMFVPHLIPVSRGIFVTAYINCQDQQTAASLPERYRAAYAHCRFIRFRSRPPRLVDVVGTNFCDISVVVRDSQVVVMSALDNLGKGMAGQCIQNLNLMFGLPEECGLINPALGPT
jgi:N-acetyl-gamma-glutamyl-phosphate/LysW-gamma-L-alpha-aminoadipyl-6-phosphate reductase